MLTTVIKRIVRRPLLSLAGRYSADGRLLSLETVRLEPGQTGELTASLSGGAYLRVFALDADSLEPLCAPVTVPG